MRLWSIHPKYLDAKGLVALWREALLAQSVLRGRTRGYQNHPQLERFKSQKDSVRKVALYLTGVHKEAERRGYQFRKAKIARVSGKGSSKIPVPQGQILYEFGHLKGKLKVRDPERYKGLNPDSGIDLHPLFRPVDGGVAGWERVS